MIKSKFHVMISKSFSPKGFQSRFYDVKNRLLSQLFQILLHVRIQVLGFVCKYYWKRLHSRTNSNSVLNFPRRNWTFYKKEKGFLQFMVKFCMSNYCTTASLGSSRKITRILTALFWLTNKHQFMMINM